MSFLEHVHNGMWWGSAIGTAFILSVLVDEWGWLP